MRARVVNEMAKQNGRKKKKSRPLDTKRSDWSLDKE